MRRLAPALALALVGSALLGPVGSAAAHGDEVVLEVLEATPSDEGSSVTYRVALTYLNDGDGIDGATVTVTAFPAGGQPSAPQELAGTGDGTYEVTVAFPAPGRWRVQFDAADPAAQVTATYRVEAPAPPTTSTTPSTTSPPPTSAAVEPTLTDDDTAADGDGPPVGLFVGLAVAALLFVAATVHLVRRRRAEARSPGKDQSPDMASH